VDRAAHDRPTRTPTRTSVAVVGGGLAGLTAALELARADVPAVLLDGSGQLGGRARSSGPDGYVRNLGPHALATGGPGTAVLERLGIDLPGALPPLHRAKLLVDGRIVSPLVRRHGGGGVRAGGGLARLALDARRGDPDGTVAEWLERRLPDPRTRAVGTVLARLSTYADSLDQQAADLFGEALRSGTVRYLHGGWGALVDRLRRAAVDAGASIRTGAAVRAVERTVGAWRVVTRDGQTTLADAVVVAAGGPDDVAALLHGDERRVLERWAGRVTPVRMACLDVALSRRPVGPSGVFGTDEPLYLSVQSDVSRTAPAGGAVVQVARFLPAGEAAPAGTRARLEALLDQALPAWRDAVVHARYLPDLTVTHDACLAAAGGRRARPGPAVPGAPGLFVAGDWVGTRGTLSQASIASASAAAGEVVRHLAAARPDRRQEQPA
jgi:phytoene dehydrogenase-like protein